MQRKIKIDLDYLSAQKSSILLFVLSRGRILRCAIGNSTEAGEMVANRRVMNFYDRLGKRFSICNALSICAVRERYGLPGHCGA